MANVAAYQYVCPYWIVFHIMFQRLLPTKTFPWKPSPRLNLKAEELSSERSLAGILIEKKRWGERQVQVRPYCSYALHAFLLEYSSVARCGHAPPTTMKIHYYHPDLIVIISEWVHVHINCSAFLFQSMWKIKFIYFQTETDWRQTWWCNGGSREDPSSYQVRYKSCNYWHNSALKCHASVLVDFS